jgi:alkanesulfonate monooxygenase SsuD/methylene tetrahydromethanopterin reductase-like flavin-dependent oxidoreductase (luciferase family)
LTQFSVRAASFAAGINQLFLVMRHAIDLPNFGDYGDPRLLADLAQEAEEHGWDGFFVWDHILAPGAMAVADPTVTLAAIALKTNRIWFGPMVIPLPRRAPWKVAREALTLDHLSNGRLILGIGLGGDWFSELTTFGLALNDILRAEQLEEGLAILTALMSGEAAAYKGRHYTIESTRFVPAPIQKRIPIWIAATWPRPRPFRRAAKYDGVAPISSDLEADLTVEQLRGVRTLIAKYRASEAPFDIIHFGTTAGRSREEDAHKVAAFGDAGATWWFEAPNPWKSTLTQVRNRIRFGPPKV